MTGEESDSSTNRKLRNVSERAPGVRDPAPRVEVRRSARRRRTVTAYRDGNTVVVLVPARLSAADEAHHVDALVSRLLAREARARSTADESELLRRAYELSQRYLAPQLGEAVVPVSVSWASNQLRRWGSCTPAAATIRLSSRLQTMPRWVSDYVLLHELVHLVEPGHNPRFRRLLAGYPDAERAHGYLQGYSDAGRAAPEQNSAGAEPPDEVDDGVRPG